MRSQILFRAGTFDFLEQVGIIANIKDLSALYADGLLITKTGRVFMRRASEQIVLTEESLVPPGYLAVRCARRPDDTECCGIDCPMLSLAVVHDSPYSGAPRRDLYVAILSCFSQQRMIIAGDFICQIPIVEQDADQKIRKVSVSSRDIDSST